MFNLITRFQIIIYQFICYWILKIFKKLCLNNFLIHKNIMQHWIFLFVYHTMTHFHNICFAIKKLWFLKAVVSWIIKKRCNHLTVDLMLLTDFSPLAVWVKKTFRKVFFFPALNFVTPVFALPYLFSSFFHGIQLWGQYTAKNIKGASLISQVYSD